MCAYTLARLALALPSWVATDYGCSSEINKVGHENLKRACELALNNRDGCFLIAQTGTSRASCAIIRYKFWFLLVTAGAVLSRPNHPFCIVIYNLISAEQFMQKLDRNAISFFLSQTFTTHFSLILNKDGTGVQCLRVRFKIDRNFHHNTMRFVTIWFIASSTQKKFPVPDHI